MWWCPPTLPRPDTSGQHGDREHDGIWSQPTPSPQRSLAINLTGPHSMSSGDVCRLQSAERTRHVHDSLRLSVVKGPAFNSRNGLHSSPGDGGEPWCTPSPYLERLGSPRPYSQGACRVWKLRTHPPGNWLWPLRTRVLGPSLWIHPPVSGKNHQPSQIEP